MYWDQGNYVGFGSAAHSHVDGRRYWNVRTPDRYIAMVENGERPLGGEEVLDDATRNFERDSLALRTRRGVPVEAFESLDAVSYTHLGYRTTWVCPVARKNSEIAITSPNRERNPRRRGSAAYL